MKMVDDFIVCIDRIIASTTCFGSSVSDERDARESEALINVEEAPGNVGVNIDGGEGCSSSKKERIVECRICQEDDQVQAMEAPCSCNGTLKVSALWVSIKVLILLLLILRFSS